MENNPVGWFEVYLQDMDRAKKFYESVFQIKLEKLNNPDLELWRFPMLMDRMGASGVLVKMEGFQYIGMTAFHAKSVVPPTYMPNVGTFKD